MAVAADVAYLEELVAAGTVEGPVLEVGSRAWQGIEGNFRATSERLGVGWEGCDLEAGDGVDFVLDVLDRAAVRRVGRRWRSVLLFNLLEHVYDPAAALANALVLTEPGGACAIAGPTVWQLHDYPADYWRPMPAFFEEFARRHGCRVEMRRWLLDGRTMPGDALRDGDQLLLPSWMSAPQLWGSSRWTRSRVVHRLFDTVGRRTPFPLSGYGVVLRPPG